MDYKETSSFLLSKVMKNNCYQQSLSIDEDYRKSQSNKKERFLFPINEDN